MAKLTKLSEHEVYWINKRTVISIHLSNNQTGARDSQGHLKDNIKNEGWFLFKGEGVGRMKPVRKLSERQALNIINQNR